MTGFRIRNLAVLGAACLTLLTVAAASALGRASETKVVSYHGIVVRVPQAWPVFNLGLNPRTCVRFDRHAVYLGAPGPQEQCPAHAVGRTEAILLAPVRTEASGRRSTPTADALPASGRVTSSVRGGVEVTATWSGHPQLVAGALGRKVSAATASAAPTHAPRAVAAAKPAQSGGGVYTGLGFDACHAPSTAQMNNWLASPYRAIGVYVGGENEACAQPNLTASWVQTEVAAGWHLIPTYVGLQAPSNSCGCQPIKPSQAAAEGSADAAKAVVNAQAIGIAPGSPIYDDMEYYARGSNTSAVLAYLAAWTTQLHAAGYGSGVYGNSDSVMADLVSRYGTGYAEPDDIWFAQWNGAQNTITSYVPATEWGAHQRIHQYSGGRNQTYGGTTINIDGNYVDALTVGGPPPAPAPAPSLSVSPASNGITTLHPSWPREPGIAFWQIFAGATPTSLTAIGTWPVTQSKIPLRGASSYFEVLAYGPAGQVIGASPVVAAPAHLVLIGKTAYVSAATGAGTLPAGCYIGVACSVATTIKAGRTRIARTGGEFFQPNSAGTVRFQLYGRGRRMLAHGRVATTVRLRDASGRAVSVPVTLIPYRPARTLHPQQFHASPAFRIVSLTAFVGSHSGGSVLAGCQSVAPCQITAYLAVGNTVIAAPHTGAVGGNEFGYLSFSLNSRGRALLGRARGTLAARVALTDSFGDIATARITLVKAG